MPSIKLHQTIFFVAGKEAGRGPDAAALRDVGTGFRRWAVTELFRP